MIERVKLKSSLIKALLSIIDEILVATAILLVLIIIKTPIVVTLTVLAVSLTILILLFYKAYKALSKPSTLDIIGKVGEVVEELNPKGLILVDGVLWVAESSDRNEKTIPKGVKVLIVDREGLIVKVKRVE